ncbi:MAG TPA: discoidin domain-containing protein [Anaerohalosphaeraceae bacterium]|nr:discoidin domain-containing protein [Anaerohalosphaeraceae bacterium]HOL30507.1 discoidin domain-containing protein [Anaerohalosphaeraceae bacterium]HOM75756.1 discoidin domain-containing protein [Anaerohalosphaeraceae bacterium]HPC63953.1 discoidin domain-containing protein [Anaerohalosphaeraceae bacterium]HPO69306.1 discoidin domain-containing protein [Anaerohalosphaeraceae bacterium]
MKRILFLIVVTLVWAGCRKQAPAEAPQSPSQPQTSDVQQADPAQPAASDSAAPKSEEKMVPLPLELPKPMFVGTPENLAGIENLEPDTKGPRPVFYVPEGVKNLALNKPVTSSEMEPITGELSMLVDGDKDAAEGSVIELGPFKQWVQVDLGQSYNLYAIVFWHYHKTPRVYFDVVVQVSDDPEFAMGVTTLFNNDTDNSLGLGAGKDMHYIDKAEGKLVDAKGTKARYVRLYSQANNQNDYSHYIEVEVYGK